MTATTEVASVADEESNDFRLWMQSMGYNAKQVSIAGGWIGMSTSLAGHSSRGLRDLTITERLAMAAATVGLPEWKPENAAEIEAVKTIYEMLKAELQLARSGAEPEAEAIRTIRAVIRSEAHRLATEARSTGQANSETDQAILALLRAAVQGTSGR